MKTYDWIVIGGGITGSALSYELVKKGLSVLLLEKENRPENATRYSYGGLAYWSGTTELTRKICQEGIDIQRHLSEELEAETEFREIDLVLTIDVADNPKTVAENYRQFAISPQLLNPQEACELEPLLNPDVISGVLKLPHGHIHPQKTNQAYQTAFQRLGGDIKIEQAIQLIRQENKIEGVTTDKQNYYANNTVICAGGLSRSLLKVSGINVRLYFTHAQLIKTIPVDIRLRTLVMPAIQKRLILEAKASQLEMDSVWENSNPDLMLSILEPGAIQFLDGSLCMGQMSQISPNFTTNIDPIVSEAEIRTEVGRILPSLKDLPGTWHRCLVAFANNTRPLVGEINSLTGVYIFSGFTSTLLFAPPLARHFANWAVGENDAIIPQLST